ncbi:MAG: DUF2949 domain-containing protein [Limnospira sp. PMC 1291.21]|uniref:DUF2949 domain-containing protein n=1 Tax=Limnospira TaxID=2596745 RepID=UPI0002EF8948|nr:MULTISPECIES: DUF2949 domain-containing protein [Limnospira]MDC0836976.1 DUF2949 domain-containing protein [Limnoraphis robusta]QJB27980.1 DUF2949 domain-containing protein [Limnospira fusiformis SAG 85.79]UWU50455.1 Protein of unknown function (DUF2949) [Arthrospira platensis C1]MDT9179055.1 DUF2949 domain-containing protein [Limnospira sp. PMC 1238.20]MDT9194257.1 DUF2949 domain-containing protein [Limnospira sp. PMC 1245.20]
MTPTKYAQFLNFLTEELSISQASIEAAQRVHKRSEEKHKYPDPSPLSMTLWQYGLVTLEQLEKIFDWLATAY